MKKMCKKGRKKGKEEEKEQTDLRVRHECTEYNKIWKDRETSFLQGKE